MLSGAVKNFQNHKSIINKILFYDTFKMPLTNRIYKILTKIPLKWQQRQKQKDNQTKTIIFTNTSSEYLKKAFNIYDLNRIT